MSLLLSLGLAAAATAGMVRDTVRAASCPPSMTAVACENTLPGDPKSDWQVQGSGDASIQGFPTDISVNVGETVHFKISSPSIVYHIDILRVGYYQGNGARIVASGVRPSATTTPTQPSCLSDAGTGLVDCGNWAESASWQVPTTAVSGVYIAHLVRDDAVGGSHIMFVVRNDASHSDLLYQTSDSTWQAYNRYGGNSFYVGGPAPPFLGSGRAYKLSYNRPITTRDCCPEDFFFGTEYPLVRFIEANGYDVSYTTDLDTDRRGGAIKQHHTFVSSGHDEYWSGTQRANVEAARDAGVNLALFAGNNVYWKTRWENSIDGTGTPYRTLVSYKETWAGKAIDPAGPPTATAAWRDMRFGAPADGARPENALIGTLFTVNQGSGTIQVPAAYANLRFWRNTQIASLTGNQVKLLAPDTLGYEWNEDVDNGFRPPGLIDMSSTTLSVPQKILDYGSTVGPGQATHSLTLYKAPSGARVFSSGTVQWSWGLDTEHDQFGGAADANMQQATINLLADMGAQPSTLQPGLVAAAASTDTTAPHSVVASPTTGSVTLGTPVTVSGTAADTGGGTVAGVEVSTDGGTTWHPASGGPSWTYRWIPNTVGSVTIKSRATDDSGNIESPGSGAQVTVNASCPCSIWPAGGIVDTASVADGQSVELGVKFRTDVPGTVGGVRFYKGAGNTGSHTGSLWSSTGQQLATATFTAESSTGWQMVSFSSPVAINANTSYVASYHAPNGGYATNLEYFGAGGANSWPLRALPTGSDGPNGLFTYSSVAAFPISSYEAANYWVDVLFTPTTAPYVAATTPAADATGTSAGAGVTATFNRAVNPASIGFTVSDPGGIAVPAAVTYNSSSLTATLQPSSTLTSGTRYTASINAADSSGTTMLFPYTWSFTTSGLRPCPCSIWLSSAVPGTPSSPDTSAIELGIKFRTDIAGYVNGIRFYKGAGNTGTHVGNLWTSTGTLLATANFSSETATGWQQVSFANPVQVSPNTTYVATYLAPAGHYPADPAYFGQAGVDNAPLHVLADGANGVFHYGAASAFPSGSYNNSNYWVDVAFMTSATVPTVTATQPAAGAGGVYASANVSATFSVPVQPGSIALTVKDPANNSMSGSITYDSSTMTATFAPASQLAFSTTYTASASATSAAGAAMPAPQTWSFTTGVAPPCPCTIWPSSATPAVADAGDTNAVELGTKFRSDFDGWITGVRFYKSTANTGTHAGNLWSSTGTLLAWGTFAGETASGWQQLTFANPVAVKHNTTYVVSYHTSVGHYSANSGDFAASGVDTPPLHALASGVDGSNGVYQYGGGGVFPSSSYKDTNYWVDAVFSTSGSPPPPPPSCPCTIWTAGATPAIIDAGDTSSVELGVKFRADVNGSVSGVRFYKAVANTGTHVGNLWSATGTLLATATFSGESASGWQQVTFSSPVAVTAGTTYVASYLASAGHYSATGGTFAGSNVDRTPLHALASGVDGSNGVYHYGASSAFPTSSYNDTNYWVDAVFSP